MTSEAYVWIWLPGADQPVVAGRMFGTPQRVAFLYGRSYRLRPDAIPIAPELPLREGVIDPLPGLTLAGALRDAAPDAWGRRVILNRLLGRQGRGGDVTRIDELTYLLESGSDRVGALDVQASAADYVPRIAPGATLDELTASAARVEAGIPLTPELDRALHHGSSLGGARPKAFVDDGLRRFVAKFAAAGDVRNVVKAEYVAMRLAAEVGLDVAPVRLARAGGRDVLLVERFDRVAAGGQREGGQRAAERAGETAGGWRRRAMLSALTLLELDEMLASYASYEDLAEIVRHRFADPLPTLRELFARMVYNILCGNTDDHARNHAAFWDGRTLALTPAYDLCPQARTGGEASQAMLIVGSRRDSRLVAALAAAPAFLLDETAARALIDAQVATIAARFDAVCDAAALPPVERETLRTRSFLNPYAFQDYGEGAS